MRTLRAKGEPGEKVSFMFGPLLSSIGRHCERSEAIQSLLCGLLDCFVAFAPRNDEESDTP
jgi:hypothetical protein